MAINSKTNRFWEIFTILVIIGILCLLLIPDVQQAVNSGPRERFRNQMKAVGLALHQYQDAYGCLPPAALKGEEGTPMHSWRALLLPLLEPYFKTKSRPYGYQFDEPSDSETNQKIASQNPHFYRFIITRDDNTKRTSKLVAIIDKSTYWNPAIDCHRLVSGNKAEKRIILMEVPGLKSLWNEPTDFTLDELQTLIEENAFATYGSHVLFDNGEVTWLSPDDITVQKMHKLLNIESKSQLAD
ncbi:DUF1559 domain-containing protein [Gimesia aquarii]|uniref:DUF1559 domain-containing protein n=1 Tax=Gimesia aquarii TaxID=2527964 RepID=A0A517X1Q1_9PLAN|nr:DUF1559 domain-containing protein [Gimesia aquarii]QDU11437.1 hypothetical protein V202x_48590 [Gimesia aquarii]